MGRREERWERRVREERPEPRRAILISSAGPDPRCWKVSKVSKVSTNEGGENPHTQAEGKDGEEREVDGEEPVTGEGEGGGGGGTRLGEKDDSGGRRKGEGEGLRTEARERGGGG